MTISDVRAWLTRHPGLVFFVTLAWIPLLGTSPTGDLSHFYTDHLHHSFATWVAIKKGLVVYTQPFAAICEGTGWPYPRRDWGNMPGFSYPPGVALVFLPLALIGRLNVLTQRGLGVLAVLWMLALAAVAFQAVVRALQSLPPGARYSIGLLAWLMLAQLGLQGFYDSVYVACGALMIVALRENRPQRALLWLAAAVLLHFRSAVLFPLGLFAFARSLRAGLSPRALTAVVAAFAVSGASFLLMYPTTAGFRAQVLPVLRNGNAQALVLGLSLAAAALLWMAREYLAVGALFIVVVLAQLEVQNFWWHGAMMLFVPLSLGVRSAVGSEQLSFLRTAALLWCFALQPLVWRDHPGELFTEYVRFFRTHP